MKRQLGLSLVVLVVLSVPPAWSQTGTDQSQGGSRTSHRPVLRTRHRAVLRTSRRTVLRTSRSSPPLVPKWLTLIPNSCLH